MTPLQSLQSLRARVALWLGPRDGQPSARRAPLGEVARGEWAPQRLITSHWTSLDAQRVLWIKNPHPGQSMQFEADQDVTPTLGTTSLDDLLRIGQRPASGRLAAIVFHIGKCGSTLLQNMLDAHARVLALGEPEIFMQIMCGFLGGTGYTEHDRDRWLTAAMNAYVNIMRPPDRHLVVKLTSICFVAIARVRTLYPGVPILVVCREPKSLIAAHLRSPVVWGGLRTQALTLPPDRHAELEHLCQRMYGMSWDTARALTNEEFIARTIGHYYQQILDLDDDLVIPMHYETMKDPERLRAVLHLCRVEESDAVALAPMIEAAKYYTKDFAQRSVYSGDKPVNIDAATLEGLVDRYVATPYERLVARSARLLESAHDSHGDSHRKVIA